MKDIPTVVLYYKDEATYLEFGAACSDKDSFHLPYRDWVARGVDFERRLTAKGGKLIKIAAPLDEFLAWATKSNAGQTDSMSRIKFATLKFTQNL